MKYSKMTIFIIGLGTGAALFLLFLVTTTRNQVIPAIKHSRRDHSLPLNNPDFIPGKNSSLANDVIVIGVNLEGKARAYPKFVLSEYHVVNDTIYGIPLLLSHCEICSGAAAFIPIIEQFPNRSLSFQVCGMKYGTIEICDHQTLSNWHPFLGKALGGPLKGTDLKKVPVFFAPWGEWRKDHPDTEVINVSNNFSIHRKHARGHWAQLGSSVIPKWFHKFSNLSDSRLANHEMVFGLSTQNGPVAFSLQFLEKAGSIYFYKNDNDFYLITKVGTFNVLAFDLRGLDQTDLKLVSKHPVRIGDHHGNQWNESGVSLQAPGKGRDLKVANGYVTEWYEWVSFFPNSKLFHFE